MKILLAPDKFKGTLTAPQAAEIEAKAIAAQLPDAEIICLPLADGGEGTVVTLTLALNGTFKTVRVKDPLGRRIAAVYGIADKTAVIEMSAASGMSLLKLEELNPMLTSTYGTGELILSALETGVEHIVIGIGGSATVDGGAGMAEALGYRFYDEKGELITNLCGENLRRIVRIDECMVDRKLFECNIRIASDVTNPLLGKNGAAPVFAPQKGAPPEMIPLLESRLKNLSDVLIRQGMIERSDLPGDGAAGGLGMGLRAFCRASSESGARLAMELTHFESLLDGVDYVITGEGCTDSQTENGKLCSEIAKACKRHHVKCILLSGAVKGDPSALAGDFQFVKTASPEKTAFEEIKRNAGLYLSEATGKLIAEYLKP